LVFPRTIRASVEQVLAAELGAALPARRSVLDFEKRFGAADQGERIQRELFKLRVAESRLKEAGLTPPTPANGLADLAVMEAEILEEEARALEPLLSPDAAGRQIGLLRLACALLHLARIGEGRARAYFTYARNGKRLPGFEEVLELAPENELFFLALRRFRSLLQAGGAWSVRDADWLRLRAATAPGRLRLRAAALRNVAEAAAGRKLPADLEALRRPFLDFEYDAAEALSWAVAGFTLKEAMSWGNAGLPHAEQAQAWRDRGLSVSEASLWAKADLLPDEAAAFKACGARDPETARKLRRQLGDVEQLLNWYRAGFSAEEVLRLRDAGVQNVFAAVQQRDAGQSPAAVGRGFYGQEQPAVAGTKAPAPGATQAVPAGPGSPGEPKAPPPEEDEIPAAAAGDPEPAAPPAQDEKRLKIFLPGGKLLTPKTGAEPAPKAAVPAQVEAAAAGQGGALEPWAIERAHDRFKIECDDLSGALRAEPPQGGAWLGWGVYGAETMGVGDGDSAAFSLPLGKGRMDLVAASESTALMGTAQALATAATGPDWQAALDRLRSARGEAAVPGGWYLHGWAPSRAWLFWGLVFKTTAVPWGQAIDFDSYETWLQRWARRCADMGEPGKLCPFTIGRTPTGGRWLALKASLNGAEGGAPRPVRMEQPGRPWERAMADFCLKMGFKEQSGAWQLLAGDEAEPE
jgi:hypothetical protein